MKISHIGKVVIKKIKSKKVLGLTILTGLILMLGVTSLSIFAAGVDTATINGTAYTKYFKYSGAYSPNDHGFINFGSFPQKEITQSSDVDLYAVLDSQDSLTDGATIEYEGKRYLREDKNSVKHFFEIEPIKWQILDIDNTSGSETLLLLSESILDFVNFDTQETNNILWDGTNGNVNSGKHSYPSLRLYLNSYDTNLSSYRWNSSSKQESFSSLTTTFGIFAKFAEQGFLEKAFNEEERTFLIPKDNIYKIDDKDGTGSCLDLVRILTLDETYGYSRPYGFWIDISNSSIKLDTNRIGFVTDYSNLNAFLRDNVTLPSGQTRQTSIWWTRTRRKPEDGGTAHLAEPIWTNGTGGTAREVGEAVGIRPLITLNLSNNLAPSGGDGSLENPYTFEVELTTKVNDLGCGDAVTETHMPGSEITLTANFLEGNTFDGWYDDESKLVSDDNPYTFTMPNSDLSLTGKVNVTPNGVAYAASADVSVIRAMLDSDDYLDVIDDSEGGSYYKPLVQALSSDKKDEMAALIKRRTNFKEYTDIHWLKRDITLFLEGEFKIRAAKDGDKNLIVYDIQDNELTYTLQRFDGTNWVTIKDNVGGMSEVTLTELEEKFRILVKFGDDLVYTSNEVTIISKPRLTYNYFGGTGTPAYIELDKNDAYGTLPSATREGYTFDGWYKENTFQNVASPSDTITANTEIFAKWIPITYKVEFDGNGSTSGSMQEEEFTYDASNPLSSNNFEKKVTVSFNADGGIVINSKIDGACSFDGWTVNADGSGTVYTDASNITDNLSSQSEAKITLYAKWSGANITLETPIKPGYTFDGWYKENTFENLAGNGGDIFVANETQTLFAKWLPNESKTFTVNHYTMKDDRTTYELKETENLTGPYDSVLKINNLKKTYSNYTLEGGKAADATEIKPESFDEETTVLFDGTRVINLYYSKNKSSGGGSGGGGGGGGGGAATPKVQEPPVLPVENGEEHKAYINGYDDGEFKPKRTITRAEFAKIIASISEDFKDDDKESYTDFVRKYKDVRTDFWNTPYIGYAISKEIMIGYLDGSFKPEANITRAEVCKVLASLFDIKDKGVENKFEDEIKNQWHTEYVTKMVKAGLINGYDDGTFGANKSITRAEVVALINRIKETTPDSTLADKFLEEHSISFKDIKKKDWFYLDVLEASINHKIQDLHVVKETNNTSKTDNANKSSNKK